MLHFIFSGLPIHMSDKGRGTTQEKYVKYRILKLETKEWITILKIYFLTCAWRNRCDKHRGIETKKVENYISSPSNNTKKTVEIEINRVSQFELYVPVLKYLKSDLIDGIDKYFGFETALCIFVYLGILIYGIVREIWIFSLKLNTLNFSINFHT